MEEVLSLLIINIAARRRPPFGMLPLLGRGRSAVCLLVGFKKVEDGTNEQLLMPLVL